MKLGYIKMRMNLAANATNDNLENAVESALEIARDFFTADVYVALAEHNDIKLRYAIMQAQKRLDLVNEVAAG